MTHLQTNQAHDKDGQKPVRRADCKPEKRMSRRIDAK